MKRVLALVGAGLLVALALAARDAIDDNGDEQVETGDGGGDNATLVVACIPELRDACEALERDVDDLRIEDPGDTIDALAAGEEIDAWVTLDPWPEMAELEARIDPGPATAVAESELVLLVRTERIPANCPSDVTWACLVDELGDLVAVPDVATASGRLVLGHAAADFLGPDLASNDFGDPAFAGRLDALGTELDDPIDDIRVRLPEPHATGALAVDLSRLGGVLSSFTQSRGASPATVAVVVAGPEADRVAGEPSFTDALADLGWEVTTDAATTGLPNAGVLVALAQEIR